MIAVAELSQAPVLDEYDRGQWRPPAIVRSFDWSLDNLRTPEGQPFDGAAFPWLEGVLDAMDDPRYRFVVLQWASRLGKTFAAQAWVAGQMDTKPRPTLFASSDEATALDIVRNKYYPMLERVPRLDKQMPSQYKRSAYTIKLAYARIKVAWSGSSSRLADYEAAIEHLNEVDKWSKWNSTEADPLELAFERAKNVPDAKILCESTPSIANYSRIERLRVAGTDSRFYVPCPFCGHYQRLRMQQIKWDKNAEGRNEEGLALHTARYECEECEGHILDEHRPRMMRAGVWCPSGCTVGTDGVILGNPSYHGDIWSSQLSSLYASSLTWGQIAQQFVRVKDKPDMLRNFVNSWLGETWEVNRKASAPEKVAERLRTERPRGTVPEWGRLIAVAADYQETAGGYYPFVVVAIGDQDRAAVIEFGTVLWLDEYWTEILKRSYQHEDGGEPMQPSIAGVDSGFDTKTVYDFCNKHGGVLALKGSSTDLGGQPYRVNTVSGSRSGKSRVQGLDGDVRVLHVNTDFWETDLQNRLDKRKPDESGCLNLCDAAANDLDFMHQLCNGVLSDAVDSRGNEKLKWVKRWPNAANDYRDVVRYALCLGRALLDDTRGYVPPRKQAKAKESVQNPAFSRPDGRPWV